MKLAVENIQIVYAESESGIAQSIRDFLLEKLHGGQAPQATAIVLVSDKATEDDDWQSDVRALPSGVRLIPAGQTINADYSNPEVIPPTVEELNFIRIDDDLYANIWESIIVDADFYNVRTNVLVNMDAWIISEESDAFLLDGYREARKSLRVVRQKLQSETDENSRDQLARMETYLEASRKKALRGLFATARQRTLVVALLALLIGLIITAVTILGYMQRAINEMALLGVEHTEANAFENSVRLLDGVSTPLDDSNTRYYFWEELVEYLDISWCTTPIGMNYKHKLTDAQLLDDRYILTATDHGHMLVWDTYNGTIEEDNTLSGVSGLRALHLDAENGIEIVVTTDNKVLFGIDGQWMSNDYAYPFAEDSAIEILTDENRVLIYDAHNVYTYERTADGGIRPATYITKDTMPYEGYTIHGAVLTSEGHAVAFDAGDEMYFRIYTSDGETGYYMEVAPLSTCNAAVREGQFIFSDADGNLMLFEAESIECNPIGLELPDPRIICFVDETTIAYYDGVLGTHLYDFKQHIDLGSIFSTFSGVDELASNGTTVMCHAGGLYTCQPIDTMLPVQEIDKDKVVACYDASIAQSDGLIDTIAIFTDHTVQIDCSQDGQSTSYILDGGHYSNVGPALSDYWVLPEDAVTYTAEPMIFDGHPTVVGIIDNGNGFVVGTEDGTFQEFVIRTNGSLAKHSAFQAPSHAAITAIYEMDDCYYLLDEAGNYWKARLAYPGTEGDSTLILDQINAKLHHGVTKELYDSVSPETRADMHMTIMPGGDGKEWE